MKPSNFYLISFFLTEKLSIRRSPFSPRLSPTHVSPQQSPLPVRNSHSEPEKCKNTYTKGANSLHSFIASL